jgi:hypothetical protein
MTGCSASKEPVANNVLITDVRVTNLDIEPMGKSRNYFIYINKNAGSAEDMKVQVWFETYQAIDNLVRTSTMLGESEKLKFDVMVDSSDQRAVGISLSSNRK